MKDARFFNLQAAMDDAERLSALHACPSLC